MTVLQSVNIIIAILFIDKGHGPVTRSVTRTLNFRSFSLNESQSNCLKMRLSFISQISILHMHGI